MIEILTLGLIVCGMTGLVASIRTFLIASTIFMLLLAFGPVAYRYAETGSSDFIWEAVFRVLLLSIVSFFVSIFVGAGGSGKPGQH